MAERKKKDWRKEDIERKASGGKRASRYGDKSKRSPSKSPQRGDFKPADRAEASDSEEGIIIRKEGGERKYEGSGPKPSEIPRETPAKKEPYVKKEKETYKRRTTGIGFGERDESGKRKPLERNSPSKSPQGGDFKRPYSSRDETQDARPKTQDEKIPFGQRNLFKSQEAKRRSQDRKFGDKKPYSGSPPDRRAGKSFDDRKSEENNEFKPFEDTRRGAKDTRPATPYNEEKKPFANAETLRLNKFIANAGICSRRQADVHIAEGDVTVNGEVVKEMGYRVMKTDDVKFKGKQVEYGRKVYILLNKPKDFITTKSDERDRKTVMELIHGATDEKVYPVGRLDRNTTGLLLLTNDGELTQQLTHPSFGISKIYHVWLNKPVEKEDMEKIAAGVELEDGVAAIDDIAYADAKDKSQVGIELHIGKNRIVRRIFETLGYDVIKLDRVVYAGITKKDLPRGKWRFLSEKEVMQLKKFNEKR